MEREQLLEILDQVYTHAKGPMWAADRIEALAKEAAPAPGPTRETWQCEHEWVDFTNKRLRCSQPKGHSWNHSCAPPLGPQQPAPAVAQNPHGERLKAELVAWLEKNGIVSVLFETAEHKIDINSLRLPPEIKCVLRKFGCIYVKEAAAPSEAVWNATRHPWEDGGAAEPKDTQ